MITSEARATENLEAGPLKPAPRGPPLAAEIATLALKQ